MNSIRICDRCEVTIASFECPLCRQSDGVTHLSLCQGCSALIHCGKARNHQVVAIEYTDALVTELIDLEKRREVFFEHRNKANDVLQEIPKRFDTNCSELQLQVMDLKDRISVMEKRLLKGLEAVCQEKIHYLRGFTDSCDNCLAQHDDLYGLAVKKMSSGLSSKQEREDLEKQLHEHKKNTSNIVATPVCSSSCGFCPSFAPLHSLLDTLSTYCPWDLKCGQRYPVAEVGSLQPSGKFTVLLAPDEHTPNILKNISHAISAYVGDSSSGHLPPLPHPLVPGQLCSAKYSGDNSWHRARVERITTPESMQVMFLDYGNSEEVQLSDLRPLHDKFLTYPFRVLDCCFAEDALMVFDKREVKWKFKDLVAGRKLAVVLVKKLITSVFVVQLLDVTSEEAFDIGVTILTFAQALVDSKPVDFIARDIRYKTPTDISNVAKVNSSVEPDVLEEKVSTVDSSPSTELNTGTECVSKGLLDTCSNADHQQPSSLLPALSCAGCSPLGLLHPSVQNGANLMVIVNCEIDKEGILWVQAEPSDLQYQAMHESIQESGVVPSASSPVHQGEYCLALFPEDMKWYRGVVESVNTDVYRVRYVDFGNVADLRREELAELGPHLRVLPPQAFKCSILGNTHSTLTEKELKMLNQSIPCDSLVLVKILQVDKDMNIARVTVFVECSGQNIDVLQIVGTTVLKSSDATDLDEWTPGFNVQKTNWADEMESKESCSPSDLMMLGHDDLKKPDDWGCCDDLKKPDDWGCCDDLKKPDDCGGHVDHHKEMKEGKVTDKEVVSKSSNKPKEVSDRPREARNRTEEASSLGREKDRPRRLNKDDVRKMIHSNLEQGRDKARKSTLASANAFPPSLPVNTPPTLAQTDVSYEKSMDESAISDWAEGRPFTAVTADGGSRKQHRMKCPSSVEVTRLGDQNTKNGTVKLSVKNFPVDLSRESLIEMFASFGKVHSLCFHPEDRCMAIIIMDSAGALHALSDLNGLCTDGKVMIVKICHDT